jgi:hypothetical protein
MPPALKVVFMSSPDSMTGRRIDTTRSVVLQERIVGSGSQHVIGAASHFYPWRLEVQAVLLGRTLAPMPLCAPALADLLRGEEPFWAEFVRQASVQPLPAS